MCSRKCFFFEMVIYFFKLTIRVIIMFAHSLINASVSISKDIFGVDYQFIIGYPLKHFFIGFHFPFYEFKHLKNNSN